MAPNTKRASNTREVKNRSSFMTSSKLPTTSNIGRRSLLPKSNRFSSRISKPSKTATISSTAKSILQYKDFKVPVFPKGCLSSKIQGLKDTRKLGGRENSRGRNVLQQIENIRQSVREDEEKFSDEILFEEDPDALASILNNEGVSSNLLQKTQIEEAKKEGKSADDILLLPDGRPSLCRRVPTNRTSVISSRPSAGPGRVERTSIIAPSPFIKSSRQSFRTSTRDSLYSFIERRYSQAGSSSVAPSAVTSRQSLLSSAKPRPMQTVHVQRTQDNILKDEQLQNSLARRVLKREKIVSSPALRVASPARPVFNSPSLRVKKSGKTPGKACVRWADEPQSPPKITILEAIPECDGSILKDNVAVALFQDEEVISPEKGSKQSQKTNKNIISQSRKSISRLKPVSQIQKRQSFIKNKPTITTDKTGIPPTNRSKLAARSSGRFGASQKSQKTQKAAKEEFTARFVEADLIAGEEMVQPRILNDKNVKIKPQKENVRPKQESKTKVSEDDYKFVNPKTINEHQERKSRSEIQKIPKRLSKLPSFQARKTNVDIDDVLQIMNKKLAAIKRRSVQAELSSVIKSVEMTLASSSVQEEEEGTKPEEASPDAAQPLVKKETRISPKHAVESPVPSPNSQSWKELLSSESNSPTWKEILSKENKTLSPFIQEKTEKSREEKKQTVSGNPCTSSVRLAAPSEVRSKLQKPTSQAISRDQKTSTYQEMRTTTRVQVPASDSSQIPQPDVTREPEKESEVARHLRESYEESLRQLEETEAEKKRIEMKMKRLTLEKRELEKEEKKKDPPLHDIVPLSEMENVKNRILDNLQAKISPTSNKTSVIPTSKGPASSILIPSNVGKFFGPILSPQNTVASVPVKTSQGNPEAAPGQTKSRSGIPCKVPGPAKPDSANTCVWDKASGKKVKKISSGRIGPRSCISNSPKDNRQKPEECPIIPIVSPSSLAFWKTKTPQVSRIRKPKTPPSGKNPPATSSDVFHSQKVDLTQKVETGPNMEESSPILTLPEFPFNTTENPEFLEGILPRKSVLSSSGSSCFISDTFIQNATLMTPGFLSRQGMTREQLDQQVKDFNLEEFMAESSSLFWKELEIKELVCEKQESQVFNERHPTSNLSSPSMWSKLSEKERLLKEDTPPEAKPNKSVHFEIPDVSEKSSSNDNHSISMLLPTSRTKNESIRWLTDSSRKPEKLDDINFNHKDENGNLTNTTPEEKRVEHRETKISPFERSPLIETSTLAAEPDFSTKITPMRNLIDFSLIEDPKTPPSRTQGGRKLGSLLDITHGLNISPPLLPIPCLLPTVGATNSFKVTEKKTVLPQAPLKATPDIFASISVSDNSSAGNTSGPIFNPNHQAGSTINTIAAPKPIKPPPPQTPAAFRMLRAKFRDSPSPRKFRPRSPYAMQSPSRGVSKISRKKPSLLTSSPSIKSVCTRRFAEALLDEEVALFTCRNFSNFSSATSATPGRKNREISNSNPLGRVLMKGDDSHFIPISPIPMPKKPPKANAFKGSAFSAFNPTS